MKVKMKLKVLLYLFLAISTLSLAQQNTFNKEAELQRFVERSSKVEEISPEQLQAYLQRWYATNI